MSHGLEPFAMVDQGRDPLGQRLRGELVVEQEARTAGALHRARVRRLMTARRVGVRHQDARQAAHRQLCDGGRPGPRHHQVGTGVGKLHAIGVSGVSDQDPRRGRTAAGAERGQGSIHRRKVRGTRDQQHLEVRSAGQDAAGADGGPVDVQRTETAPEDQHRAPGFVQVELVATLLGHALAIPRDAKHFLANGIARELQSRLQRKEPSGVSEGECHGAGNPRHRAVGETGDGILLVQDKWTRFPAGSQCTRHADVSTHPDHNVRLSHQRTAFTDRRHRDEWSPDRGEPPLSHEGLRPDHSEGESRGWNEPRLQPRRRPQEHHFVTAVAERSGQRQSRVDVPGGPATHDGHAQGHRARLALLRRADADGERPFRAGATSVRPMENRTPTAASDMTRDDPPNEMNGRGTPVMGRTPVAPPRLIKAWMPSHPTMPAPSRRPNASGARTAIRIPA